MKKHKKMSSMKRIIFSLSVSILILFIFKCFTRLYNAVDNFNLSLVLNKQFSDDTYSIYLHPLLCNIIGRLSDLLPFADVYLLVSNILLIMVVTILIYLILDSSHDDIVKLFIIISIISVCFLLNIWNNNYTIHASLFSATGLILMFSYVHDKEIWKCIVGIILLGIGCMWRIQGFMLIIPFIVLEIIADVCFDNERNIKVYAKPFLFLSIVIVGLVLTRFAVMKSDVYINSVEYDKYRVKIQDYPVKQYSQVQDLNLDITEIEYLAATNWSIFDTGKMNADLFKLIARYSSVNAYQLSFKGVALALKDMFSVVWRQKSALFGTFIYAFTVLYLLHSNRFPWYTILQSILCFVGSGIILLFFTIKGRSVFHVWLSVIVIDLIMISWILLHRRIIVCKKSKVVILITCILLLWNVGFKYRDSDFKIPQFAICSRVDNHIKVFDETLNNTDIYVWGEWHKEITQYYMSKGKLPTSEFMKHNISAGDWTYGQVYFNNYLQALNISNPALALIERDDVYLVSKDCEFVLRYLQECYDENITVNQVKTVKGVPVWKFDNYKK